MTPNFIVLALAALIPLFTGFIWYNDKTFAKIWMKEAKLTKTDLEGSNMARIFGLTYLLGLFAALSLNQMVIHQSAIYSVLMNEPGLMEQGSELNNYVTDFMSKYGQNFRTFKHGVLHGVLAGLFLALPIIGINSMFERKSFKYVAIHAGYWIVTLGLMGGIICQWG